MTQPSEAVLERSFSQRDFDRFAGLSGDDNPIHVDAGFAADSRFGRTVAHGLLLVSVLRGLVDQLSPGCRVLEQWVMFPAPTYAGEAMRFSATVTGGDERGQWVRLEISRLGCGTVTCEGRCLVAP